MKKKLILSSFLGLFGFNCSIYAADLIDVYREALHKDPTYLAAYSTMLSNQEALPQSRSNLLPHIKGKANTFANYLDIFSTQNINNFSLAFMQGDFHPKTHEYSLNITQSVFNFSYWMQYKKSSYVFKQAAATFSAATQDLILRVAKAYLDALYSQDVLIYTQIQKMAYARDLYNARWRFKVGIDTMTSVYNAEAAYDSSVAREISAQNNMTNSLEALRRLTGVLYESIDGLKIELPLINPDPEDQEEWVEIAKRQNQTLLASYYAREAARTEIKVKEGGHLPTLDATASYGNYKIPFIGFNEGQVGVELNLPIYTGGYVVSQVRQARDDFVTSSSEMLKDYRTATYDARESFNNVISGIKIVEADRVAMHSAESSLDSTEESYKAGFRSIFDVLDAQNHLYNVRTTYAQDLYNYLLDTLRLKLAAGTLSPSDLININQWLHGKDQRNLKKYLLSKNNFKNENSENELELLDSHEYNPNISLKNDDSLINEIKKKFLDIDF